MTSDFESTCVSLLRHVTPLPVPQILSQIFRPRVRGRASGRSKSVHRSIFDHARLSWNLMGVFSTPAEVTSSIFAYSLLTGAEIWLFKCWCTRVLQRPRRVLSCQNGQQNFPKGARHLECCSKLPPYNFQYCAPIISSVKRATGILPTFFDSPGCVLFNEPYLTPPTQAKAELRVRKFGPLDNTWPRPMHLPLVWVIDHTYPTDFAKFRPRSTCQSEDRGAGSLQTYLHWFYPKFAWSYRRHLKGCGRVAAHAGLVVAPRPFLATGPRPLTRGREGCRWKLTTGSCLLSRPKPRPLCGRGWHNPTSGVTKPRPRSFSVGGAVHREETAEWAWLKPVVRIGHAPRKSPDKATPPQVSRGRRYKQMLGSASGVAQTDCMALPRPHKSSDEATLRDLNIGRKLNQIVWWFFQLCPNFGGVSMRRTTDSLSLLWLNGNLSVVPH